MVKPSSGAAARAANHIATAGCRVEGSKTRLPASDIRSSIAALGRPGAVAAVPLDPEQARDARVQDALAVVGVRDGVA
jgi:hypothetical protein